jgi:aspartate/methionine/tyrosine aminotransferase
MEFVAKLLDVGVAVTPGDGFGKYGEGYARITFTQPKERIVEACNRIARAF